MDQNNKNAPVIVTGLSGAGLSSVLKALEDQGMEVFDNFPLTLVEPLMDDTKPGQRIAIGIDTRSRNFDPQAVINTAETINAKIIFITCDDAALYNRFTETRRRHPLALNGPVSEGIKKERTLIQPIQAKADLTIDSTHLSIHDLRHILEGHFGQNAQDTLNITLMSFGFKNGLPREADIVMDVRFLKNPHWVPDLQPKTGQDDAVGQYVESDEAFSEFFKDFQKLLTTLLPRYKAEGKSYLTIAIGCTGGRHRSVYTVEKLKNWLSPQTHSINITHRDLIP